MPENTDVNANINVRVKDEGFDKLDLARKGLIGVGAAGVAVAGGLGAAAVAGVKMAAGFDDAINHSQAFAGVTDAQAKKYRQQILDMSTSIGVSATDMAKGLYDLASAGLQGHDAITALSIATKASAASGTDMSTVVNALTTAVNAYHHHGPQITADMNDMFQTIKLGKLEFPDLANNIGSVIPIAAHLGVGMKDLGTATAILTNQGNSAAESFQMMSNFLTSTAAPMGKQVTSLKELGLSVDAVNVKHHGMATVLGNVNEALTKALPNLKEIEQRTGLHGKAAQAAAAQMTNQDQAARKLFGGNMVAMRTFFALYGDGGKQWATTSKGMQDDNTAVADSLKKANETVQRAWVQIKAVVERYAIEAFAGVIPILHSAMNAALPVLQDLGKSVGSTLGNLGKSLQAFFSEHRKQITDFFTGFGADAKNGLAAVGNALGTVFGYFKNLFQSIANSKSDLANLRETWDNLKASGKALGDALGTIVGAFKSLIPGLASGKSGFKDTDGAASALTTTLKTVSEGIRGATELFSKVSGVVLPLVAAFGAYKVAVFAIETATKAWTAAQLLLDGAMEANPIGLAIAAIAGLTAGVILAYNNVKPFRDAVNLAWAAIKSFAGSVADAAVSVAKSAQDLWNKVSSTFNDIKGVLSAFGDWLGSHWKDIVFIGLTGFIGAAVVLWQNFGPQVMAALGSLAGKITGWLGDRMAAIGSFASKIPTTIADGISGGAHAIAQALENAVKGAIDGALSYVKAHNPFDWLKSHMPSFSLPFGSIGGGSPIFGGGGGSGHPGAAFFGLPPTSLGAGPADRSGVPNAAGHIDMMGEFNNPFYLPQKGQYQFQSQGIYPWGETEYWRTPNGGLFDFMHMNSMPTFQPGKVYGGGTYAGRSGGVPGVSPGLQSQYSTGAHLHLGYDPQALAYFQAMGGGYVGGPSLGAYGTGAGVGGGMGMMGGKITSATIHATNVALHAPLAVPTGHGTNLQPQRYGAPTGQAGQYGWGTAAWQYPGGANAGQPPGWGQAAWHIPGGDASGTGNVYGWGTARVKDDPAAIARANAEMARQLRIMDAVNSPAPRLADIYAQNQSANQADITRLTARAGQQLAMGGSMTNERGMRVSTGDATRPTTVMLPGTSELDKTIAKLAADMNKADKTAQQAEEIQRRAAKATGDFATQQSISNSRLTKATDAYANGVLSGSKDMPQLGANLSKAVANAAKFDAAMQAASAAVTKYQHDQLVASEGVTKTYSGQMKLASDAVSASRQAYLDAAVGGHASAAQLQVLAVQAAADQKTLDGLNKAGTDLDKTITDLNAPAKTLTQTITDNNTAIVDSSRQQYIEARAAGASAASLQGLIVAGQAATGQLDALAGYGKEFDDSMHQHTNTVAEDNNAQLAALQAKVDDAKALLVHAIATNADSAAIAGFTSALVGAEADLGKLQGIIDKVNAISPDNPTGSTGAGGGSGAGSGAGWFSSSRDANGNWLPVGQGGPNWNAAQALGAQGGSYQNGGTFLGYDANGNPVFKDVGGGTRTDLLGNTEQFDPRNAVAPSGLSAGGGGGSADPATTGAGGGYTGFGKNTPGYVGPSTPATIYNANPGIFGTNATSNQFNNQPNKYGAGTSMDAITYSNLYGSNSAYASSPWNVTPTVGTPPDALGTAANPVSTTPNEAQQAAADLLQKQLDQSAILISALRLQAADLREMLQISRTVSNIDTLEGAASFESAINNAGVARTANR